MMKVCPGWWADIIGRDWSQVACSTDAVVSEVFRKMLIPQFPMISWIWLVRAWNMGVSCGFHIVWTCMNKIPESADVRRTGENWTWGYSGMGSPKDETTQDLERCGMDVRPDTQEGPMFLGKPGCYWTNQVSGEFACVYSTCAYYCNYNRRYERTQSMNAMMYCIFGLIRCNYWG